MDNDIEEENVEGKYDSEVSDLKSNFYDAIYDMRKTPEFEEMRLEGIVNPLLDSILSYYDNVHKPMIIHKTVVLKKKKEKEEKQVPVFSAKPISVSYASRLKK